MLDLDVTCLTPREGINDYPVLVGLGGQTPKPPTVPWNVGGFQCNRLNIPYFSLLFSLQIELGGRPRNCPVTYCHQLFDSQFTIRRKEDMSAVLFYSVLDAKK